MAFRVEENKPGPVPLLIGLMGMPGAGKTYSALTLASGMKTAATGKPVLIDTEVGRSKKYAGSFDFLRIDFEPPFKPSRFLEAIQTALKSNPCAVIVDSMSDEHEGEGGVLDWRDNEIVKMGGNEWAAWRAPKNDRRLLTNGMLRVMTPLILCFRAREKTKQVPDNRGKMVPTNIGFQPIAPAEIVSQLDLNVLLPPKSDGRPVWRSGKGAEDFVIKLPEHFKPLFGSGQPLCREHGTQLAAWARGEGAVAQRQNADMIFAAAKAACEDGRVAWGEWWVRSTLDEKAAVRARLGELKAILTANEEQTSDPLSEAPQDLAKEG